MVEGLLYWDNAPVTIEIENGLISRITRRTRTTRDRDLPYVAPGLIDNQINGYAAISFGLSGGQLTVEGVRKATHALWKEGVTTYLPTLTTNSHEILKTNFAVLAKAVRDPDIGRSIPGYHLEGPYISPHDGFRGAHPKQWVRPPDWQEFMVYYRAADEKILQVTLAPEIEGAFEFIANCRRENIVVAIGHHNGSMEIVTRAIDAGAAISTHLGNGCANMINRHNNPLWPQLADDRIMASIICDGFHLRPEEVRVFHKVKGTAGIILTSDVTRYAGLKPGIYDADGKTIELTADGMIKYPAQNVLAGAASPITKGVGNIMKYTQCTLRDAITMASHNPAQLYGLDDRGVIAPGKRADLILFTLENGMLHIQKTLIAGDVVYER
jgi:N-acetylglucosamine-6-phosphate deacetylase